MLCWRKQAFQIPLELCAGKEVGDELVKVLKPISQSRVVDSGVGGRSACKLKDAIDPLERSTLCRIEVLIRSRNGDADECVHVLMKKYVDETTSVVAVQVDRDHWLSIGSSKERASILERRFVKSELDLLDIRLVLKQQLGKKLLVRFCFGRGDLLECVDDGLGIIRLESESRNFGVVLLACVEDLLSTDIGAGHQRNA